jgi:hypothetical protein
MRRCWRSSPPTTSRMCLRSSAWWTSALGLWKAAPGTPQPPRWQRGRARLAPGLRPQAVAMTTATTTTRRRLPATGHWPECPSSQLQWRVGAVAVRGATNTLVSRPIATTVARSARCTTPCAIPQRSTGRSRSSQNNFMKICSSSAKIARLPVGGRARRRWSPRRRKMQRWSFRMPRGH